MNSTPADSESFARRTFRIDGVDTVVREIGSGRPLVYFHGRGTFHGFDWARQLADRFRVILPHHPGFGDSGDADFAGMEDYLLHYEMLFAALELERFCLMGASMGGQMAARYAAEHPDEIERLVLVSPSGLLSPDAAMPDLSTAAHADMAALFATSPAWIAPYWPAEPSPDWLAQRARENGAAGRLRGNPQEVDASLRVALPAIACPTLLLWGEADRIIPLPVAHQWQAALPHARLEVIEQGSHLLLDEFPQSCAAASAFLLEG